MYLPPQLEARDSIVYQQAHPDDTRVPNLISATVICLAASYTAVVFRFVSRHIGKVSFGKDDFFIIVALIIGSAYSILMVTMTTLGFGRHSVFITESHAGDLGKSALAGLCILPVATAAVKISLMFLYRRIFYIREGFVKLLVVIGVLVIAWTIAATFSTIFECLPVGAQEEISVPHHCINQDLQFSILSFVNSAFDFVLLALPWPLIWQLHISAKGKLQLMCIFLVGALTCIASLARAIYSLNTSELDTTWDDVPTVMWTTVEINLSIVSACLATLRPLLRRLSYGKEDHNLPRTLDVNITNVPSKQSHDTELNVFVGRGGREEDCKPFAAKGAVSPLTEISVDSDVSATPTRRGNYEGC